MLIEETEAELNIHSAAKDPSVVPPGMMVERIQLPKTEVPIFKNILWHKDGLVHPASTTTKSALKEIGIIFPTQSTAWYDRETKLLHLINRPDMVSKVKSILK